MESNLQYFVPIILNLGRYFIFSGLAFLIFYVLFTSKFKGKIQSRNAKRKDFIREIIHSLPVSIIVGVVLALFLFTPLKQYTKIYTNLTDYPLWWPPVGLLLIMIVHDAYFYWTHRLMHHPRLFKVVHLEHHKSTNPSPWTSLSIHTYEAIIEAGIIPIILLLIPMPRWGLLIFGTIALLFSVYGHLGYEIAPKWFRHSVLFEVFNTSVHHNIHHEKFKGNYGYYFRFWDRVMGTEHPEYVTRYDRIQKQRFGKAMEVSMPVSASSQL